MMEGSINNSNSNNIFMRINLMALENISHLSNLIMTLTMKLWESTLITMPSNTVTTQAAAGIGIGITDHHSHLTIDLFNPMEELTAHKRSRIWVISIIIINNNIFPW